MQVRILLAALGRSRIVVVRWCLRLWVLVLWVLVLRVPVLWVVLVVVGAVLWRARWYSHRSGSGCIRGGRRIGGSGCIRGVG